MLDCPVEFHEENYRLTHPNFEKVTAVFQELEFRRSLDSVNKLFQHPKAEQTEAASADPSEKKTPLASAQLDLFALSPSEAPETHSGYQTAATKNHLYQFADTATARRLLLNKLLQQKEVSFSIATDRAETKILGIGFCYEAGKGYFLPKNWY